MKQYPLRGEEGQLRVGLALAYASDILKHLGHTADTTDPEKRYEAPLILLNLDRLKGEVLRILGNPCERCYGHGKIAWGSGEKECITCGGMGKGDALTRLSRAYADAIDVAEEKGWDEAALEEAFRRGEVEQEERHM
jgi:hypothetical protein